MNRRLFNKLLLGSTAFSVTACSMGSMSASRKMGNKKVVIVGGGFGGATAAKYIKRFDSSVDVTIVEENKTYHTCPFSNTVLGGINDLSFIEHDYDTLKSKYKINVVHQRATKVADGKVTLEDGNQLEYDRAIVSPGIDFKYEKGYSKNDAKRIPHAYQAGEQTAILRGQLEDMKNGGTFVMVPPKNPFRCPPGPYERVSLIAHYFKKHKPKSKIIILDQKSKFSKQALFEQGWEREYGYGQGKMIEWRSSEFGGTVLNLDTKRKVITTDEGEVKADVLNYIPNQKAGKIAFDSGLTKGDWCPINPMTFESTIAKNIHVIGDASIASKMPKSGFSASSQAKIAALQIVSLLNGRNIMQPPKLANTCYSLITPTYGISVSAVYESNHKAIAKVKGAGGLTPMDASESFRMQQALHAQSWYQNQTADMFL